MNISLDESDFKKLTSGEIIKKKDGKKEINIALKDIGFKKMLKIITDNYTRKVDGIDRDNINTFD